MFGMMNMGIVVTMRDMLSGPAMKVVKAVKDIERVSNFGDRLTRSGAQMTAFGALYSGIATNMKTRAMDFARPLYELEDSLAMVRTVAPGTFGSVDADIVQITKRAKQWSDVHKAGAVDYVQANYRMISAGLNTKAAIEGTDASLALATATMGEATVASNLLATLYNNLGIKTAPVSAEMMRLADIVTKTQQQFQLADLGQLNEGLKYATPAAIQARMELAEVAATVGLLNTAGLQGGQAGTAFGAMMRNLNKASKDLRFEIARTSDGGVDLAGTLAALQQRFAGQLDLPKTQMALQQAFGDEGMRAVTMLISNIDGMRSGVNAVRNSVGATAQAQKTMEQTGSFAWTQLGKKVDGMKMAVAQGLQPAIDVLIPMIESAAKWIKEFAQEHPGVIRLGGAVAMVAFAVLSILGPIAIVGGTIAQVVGGAIKVYAGLATVIKLATLANWAFAASLLANPITWIVLGIIALGGALVALVVYWDDVVVAVRRAGAWIKQAWLDVVAWVSAAPSRLLNWLRSLGPVADYIAAAMMVLMGPVGWLIGGAVLLVRHWSGIKQFFADLVTDVVNTFWAWVGEIKGFGSRMYESGVGLFNAFIDGIKSRINAVVDAVRGGLERVRAYLPFSDAKLGPLSELTASGKAFSATWATGIQSGIPDVRAAVEDMAADGLNVGLPDVRLAQAAPAQAPGAAGRERRDDADRRGALSVTIQTLNVQAKDVAEADGFVAMLQGLRMEVAPEV